MSGVLAIIGSAGRTPEEVALFTLPSWNAMKRLIFRFVKEREITSVISGASAWSDHLAVGLYNAKIVSELTLALPCSFNWENAQFVHGYEPYAPAYRLRDLHAAFSAVIGRDTLQELKTAIYSCEVVQRNGFHARNEVVAERADEVIAFTFGHGRVVADGGTAHTCRAYLARGKTALWHVDLNDITLHENATVG